MLAISMRLAIALHKFLLYAPTNLLLSRLRSRHGLKWGVPFTFLGAAYFLAAAMLATWLHDGGPRWLNPLVLLGIWNGLKFVVFGPISLMLLARDRITEHRDEGQRIKAGLSGSRLPANQQDSRYFRSRATEASPRR